MLRLLTVTLALSLALILPLAAQDPVGGEVRIEGGSPLEPVGPSAPSDVTVLRLPDAVLDGLPEEAGALEELPFGWRKALSEWRRIFPGLKGVIVERETRTRWGARGGEATHGGRLLVLGRTDMEAATAWIEKALLRGGPQVIFTAHVVWKREGETPGANEPVRVEFLTDPEVWEEDVFDQEGVERIASPQVMVDSAQRANVSIVNQTSYVRDFELEIARGSVVANPVVDVVEDGISLDLTPVFDARGERILVAAGLRISTVEKPIKSFTSRLSSGPEVKIEVPSITEIKWSSEDLVFTRERTWCVVRGLPAPPDAKTGESEGRMELWINARTIDAVGVEEAPGRITAHDEAEGLWFVTWKDGSSGVGLGERVEVHRDGQAVAHLTAATPKGPVQGFRLREGEVRRGDEVFPAGR